ncbi:MAG: shikimate dehydrogenase [Lachnospiraceae bacterium]|nr:shikimate dehydrogenase [Lachnospiraceae bacterium]
MDHKITGSTRLGGLLGSPVAHSISPMMHNDSFQELGLDYVYLCFEVGPEKLPEVITAFRSMNVYGFNLTMPDKEAVIPCLDELSLAAQMIGAVNTVTCQNGKMTGHNTDGIGYMRAVEEAGYSVPGKEMTLLGAGGAASAIAVQAAIDGVSRLHLVSRRGRSWEKARALVDQINRNTSCQADLTDLADTDGLRKNLERSALLTNATSVGMAPHADQTPIGDCSLFHPELIVSDVIYNPRRTRLLREAENAGCRTFNGMYMLLYQGEAAFRIWTGQNMPVELIKSRYFTEKESYE